jgi:hypothetical protein
VLSRLPALREPGCTSLQCIINKQWSGIGIPQSAQWIDNGFDDQRIMVKFLTGARHFLIFQSIQASSRANLATHSIFNEYQGAFSHGVKWLRHKVTARPYLVTRLGVCGSIPPLPHVFMAWHISNNKDVTLIFNFERSPICRLPSWPVHTLPYKLKYWMDTDALFTHSCLRGDVHELWK